MLQRLGAALKWVLGLILPVYQQARSAQSLSSGVRMVLHILVILIICVILYWLGNSRYLQVSYYLPLGETLAPLAPYWLSLLFLLVYAFCWLSYWLYLLLFPEPVPGYYPDIDAAWEEAMLALGRAQIPLSELPFYLLLGTTEDDERALLQAAQIRLLVPQVPANRAPLHIYASESAIYLTCEGASALGSYCLSLVGKPVFTLQNNGPEEIPDDEDDVLRTLGPSSSRKADPKRVVEKMANVLIQAEREGRPLTKSEKRELRGIYRQDNPQRSITRNAAILEEQAGRLEHLCRLIQRDRAPRCPLNGVVLLLPYAGTDSDSDASDTGLVCQRDLSVVTQTLRIHCPLYALLCDLETATGFADFVQQFSPRERLRRLGQRCHMVPDFGAELARDNGETPPSRMVRSLAEFMCDTVVKTFVAEKFRLEQSPRDLPSAIECNSRLFLFFDEMQQRGKRLGNILAGAVKVGRDPNLLLFGGCYAAATGADSGREQAFVRGVLERLTETQDCVYWADSALEEEARYRRWRDLGWPILIGVIVLVVLLVLGIVWRT